MYFFCQFGPKLKRLLSSKVTHRIRLEISLRLLLQRLPFRRLTSHVHEACFVDRHDILDSGLITQHGRVCYKAG